MEDRVVKKFSDFAEERGPLDGTKKDLDAILNTEILLTGYRVQPSKFYRKNGSGECLTVQFVLDNETHVFFTGSEVLKNQFEKYGSELPFWSTIKKIDKYYTLS